MPRSLWSGSLSFGLVNVPVALYSGVRDTDVHFRQLHAKDHTPIEMRRFCSQEDVEVAFEEVGHGYETGGKQVVLTDEELAMAAPRKTRTIDIEAFVDLDDVDPIHYDHPYILVPASDAEGTRRAYRLLLEVMGRTDRAALGRFVLRTKEYLALIRVRAERLTLTTMRFHDEVRPTKDVPAPHEERRPSKEQLDHAVALIDALSSPWDPSRYEDTYEQRLKRIVERKRKGQTVKPPRREEQPTPVPDLMGALERTLAEVKRGASLGGRGGRRTTET
jgi:DNA end-binding protein Ku